MLYPYEQRILSKKWSMKFNKKEIKENEFRPIFADRIAKSLFGREEKKDYLALILSDILKKEVNPNDLKFYKNEVGMDKISSVAFQCDIAVFYQEDTLFLLEFNNIGDLFHTIRNIVYLDVIFYQIVKAKKEKKIEKIWKVCLVNLNNFINSRNPKLKEEYHYQSSNGFLLTRYTKILEYYLPIGIKKYYNDGIKKEELSILEKMSVLSYMGTIEEAKKFIEGDEKIMCIIDDLLELSHSMEVENYYHSMEDAKEESYMKGLNKGEARGKVLGRKEGIREGKLEGKKQARKEVARILASLDISPDIIEKSTGIKLKHLKNR